MWHPKLVDHVPQHQHGDGGHDRDSNDGTGQYYHVRYTSCHVASTDHIGQGEACALQICCGHTGWKF